MQSITGSSVWSEGKDKSDAGSQPTTWNVDIFVEVVKDLAPHLNFREVIFEMDHPGFLLKDAQGLRIVKSAFLRVLQDVFPVEVLYRVWKNTEGQVMSYKEEMNSHLNFSCLLGGSSQMQQIS